MSANHLTPEKPVTPKVLVVDDDSLVRDVVVESLQSAGYQVDWCANGLLALGKNGQINYDLIITDMMMPSMDGLTLIRNLKLQKSDTDVIVITGFGSVENAVDCMKAGAQDYLIKPLSVEQIQMAARRAIEHRELRLRARERDLYRQLSYEDSLTGIYNRRFFDESLKLEIVKSTRHGAPVLLCMIDIDYFKMYNDHRGHQNGDRVLAEMGQILKSSCRGYDIVTRYGGEEFAIIFPGTDKSEADNLASRIMEGVDAASFDGEDLMPFGSLTVSIGMASFPEDATNGEDLIRRADEALYTAKRDGRNTVRIYGLA
ncbi:MAG: diguanylate cyclase [Deltaproteobacteria bacterium]|jgi:diguanylate cyclase (GGDEF)-like protein|nr:diguanylate cyclase [Deltaproteobacteria bacterium]